MALCRTERTVAILLTNELVCLYHCLLFSLATKASVTPLVMLLHVVQCKAIAEKTKILEVWSLRYLVNKMFNRAYSNKRSVHIFNRLRTRVSAGTVDNKECSSFVQGARQNMAKKQPCMNATSLTHKPIFGSISLLCNHALYYDQ